LSDSQEPPRAGSAPPAARLTRDFGHKAGLIFFGRLIQGIGQLVMVAMLAHLLDKGSVAVLTFLFLLYNTVSTLTVMATPENVLFFLPKQTRGERRATARQIARILVVLGFVAAGIILLCHLFPGVVFAKTPLAAVYAPLLAAYAVFEVPATMLPNLLIAEDHHRLASWVSIFQALVQMLAVLLPCLLGLPLWMPFAWLVGYGVLHCTVLLLALHYLYRGVPQQPPKVTLRQHASFALPLGISSVMGQITQQFDKFVVQYVFGMLSFADYSFGAWEIPLVTILPFSIGAAVVPLLVRAFEERRPQEALALWKSTIPKTSLLVLPIAVVFLLCADDFIELAFGTAYLRAATPLRLYTVILFHRVVEYGAIMRAAGETKAVLHCSIILFVSNAVLSVPLAYLVGFNGPALATLLANVPSFLYVLHRIAKATNSPWRRAFPWADYGKVFGLAALAALPAIAFRIWVRLPAATDFAVVGAGYLALFVGLASAAGAIRRSDWAFVGRWLTLRQLVARGDSAPSDPDPPADPR
jgi:O-antigen/teichoic acid export membrane protein